MGFSYIEAVEGDEWYFGVYDPEAQCRLRDMNVHGSELQPNIIVHLSDDAQKLLKHLCKPKKLHIYERMPVEKLTERMDNMLHEGKNAAFNLITFCHPCVIPKRECVYVDVETGNMDDLADIVMSDKKEGYVQVKRNNMIAICYRCIHDGIRLFLRDAKVQN